MTSSASPQWVSSARVLIVDDEESVARSLARLLARVGHRTTCVTSGAEALSLASSETFDAVVSDVRMPGVDGVELLRALHARDARLPVIFLTGDPSVRTAAKAVEHGAFRYLTKPVDPDELVRAVEDAGRASQLARARDPLGAFAALEANFRSALDGLWIAFQPILDAATREPFGYEALLRSREPALPHPGAVIDAAEKLGQIHVLGRHVRALVAAELTKAPTNHVIFVNLHPADLADPDLYDPTAPLSAHARRVVLEVTERSTLEGIGEVQRRIAALRELHYRIAVDDLGAGYAGLSYFATVQPEIVKIDMSLVRDIDSDSVKQRVVLSMTNLSRALGIEVVGEGVETEAERDALVRLGCTHLQGYLFARPGEPFPVGRWSP